jgi:hypothetical protein
MIQKLEAIPSLTGRRGINQSEQNARNDLHHQDNGCGAAKYIPPARATAWNRMFGCFGNRSSQPYPPLKPTIQLDGALFQPWHGECSGLATLAWVDNVGNSPALIMSWSPAIL